MGRIAAAVGVGLASGGVGVCVGYGVAVVTGAALGAGVMVGLGVVVGAGVGLGRGVCVGAGVAVGATTVAVAVDGMGVAGAGGSEPQASSASDSNANRAATVGGRRSDTVRGCRCVHVSRRLYEKLVIPLDHVALGYDGVDAVQRCYVFVGVAVDDENVRGLARFERAYLVLQTEALG